jgi:Ca2+-binding RTX toxin-like protein
VDLSTGAATEIGAIGGGAIVRDISVGPASGTIFAVTAANDLLSFNATTPGTIATTAAITGLMAGEQILGIDFRPANGLLYALGITGAAAPFSGQLYTINTTTGAATLVGTGPFSTTLTGTSFGFDFNPVPDRIRLVSDTEENLRLNPDTGAIAGTDTNLVPAGNVVGSAYDRNFVTTAATTLFGIDSASDMLVRQGGVDGTPSPNDGVITNIGALGFNTTDQVGFDIAGGVLGALTINGDAHDAMPTTAQSCSGAADNTLSVGDTLNVTDGAERGAQTYTLTATTFQRTGTALVTYGTVETVALTAGVGSDTISAMSTAASVNTTVNAGDGGDTITIESTGAMSNVRVNGQVGTDTVNVRTTAAGSITQVNGGTENDTMTVGSLAAALGGTVNSIAGCASFNGDGDSDTLTVDDSGDATASMGVLSASSITGLGNTGQINFGSQETLNALLGSANDTLSVLFAPSLSAMLTVLNGGGGNDSSFVEGTAAADMISVAAVGSASGIQMPVFELVRLNGNAGSDTLSVAAIGTQTISRIIDGGAGNDVITGSVGADVLIGGPGGIQTVPPDAETDQDMIDCGGAAGGTTCLSSGDVVFRTVGEDTLAANCAAALQFDESAAGGGGAGNVFVGTSGDDLIDQSASMSDLIILGFEGNDTIRSGSGNDTIDGGLHSDSVEGGSGNDAIFGSQRCRDETGNDRLFGQAGADFIEGGEGDDFLDGGADSDVVVDLFGGTDMLLGGTTNHGDTMAGGPGNDTYDGGPGNDLIVDSILLEFTLNVVDAMGNPVPGGQNRSLIYTDGGGNDTMLGGDGDDSMNAGQGDDCVDGGAGNDRIVDVHVEFRLDSEDRDRDGILDPGEDLDLDGPAGMMHPNGRIDQLGEDVNRNGMLDTIGEDANGNFRLDPGEDLNNNGFLDIREDLDQDGQLDPTRLDPFSVMGTLRFVALIQPVGGGNDIIIGGDGNDTVAGGTGTDMVFGDTMVGGPCLTTCDDVVMGAILADERGIPSNQPIRFLDGNDVLRGGPGADILIDVSDMSQRLNRGLLNDFGTVAAGTLDPVDIVINQFTRRTTRQFTALRERIFGASTFETCIERLGRTNPPGTKLCDPINVRRPGRRPVLERVEIFNAGTFGRFLQDIGLNPLSRSKGRTATPSPSPTGIVVTAQQGFEQFAVLVVPPNR